LSFVGALREGLIQVHFLEKSQTQNLYNCVEALGGGPRKPDSVLSSDSDPAWRIRDEKETQKAQCPIQG
jgi:hypothetical protein